LHASHAGAPLLGDGAYGGSTRITLPGGRVVSPKRIALHAAKVELVMRGKPELVIECPVPSDLRDLWSALGGEAAAWDTAVGCTLDDLLVPRP
jgi:hypothetical protein